MILEALGTFKALTALKGAVTGVTASVPTIVSNSALATDQAVVVATPVVTKGLTTAGHGAIVAGAMTAKGLTAAKAGATKLGTMIAGGTTAAVPAVKGTLGTALAQSPNAIALPHGGQSAIQPLVQTVVKSAA